MAHRRGALPPASSPTIQDSLPVPQILTRPDQEERIEARGERDPPDLGILRQGAPPSAKQSLSRLGARSPQSSTAKNLLIGIDPVLPGV